MYAIYARGDNETKRSYMNFTFFTVFFFCLFFALQAHYLSEVFKARKESFWS